MAALNKTINNNITEYHTSLNMNENGHSNISKAIGKQKTYWIVVQFSGLMRLIWLN